MGKKSNAKNKATKKMTKKEKKQMNHLKLIKGKQEKYEPKTSSDGMGKKKAA